MDELTGMDTLCINPMTPTTFDRKALLQTILNQFAWTATATTAQPIGLG